MFDVLLKSKFYAKCKADTKMTKTRLEMIKRKRRATEKYLKNDIADLLKNGLDYNAYGRAEGLLIELNMSSCYDFVEQSCMCISGHLSAMNKERECPEECKEAVQSLIFAAARFSDLPELRELRKVFSQRYGTALESCVNKEFVRKLKSAPSMTKDKKIQLLQEIALESGTEWDSKALEQKLYKPPAAVTDGSENENAADVELLKVKDNEIAITNSQSDEFKKSNSKHGIVEELKVERPIYCEKPEVSGDVHNRRGVGVDVHNRRGLIGLQNSTIPQKGASEERGKDKNHVDFNSIPPPYTKPRVFKNESRFEVPSASSNKEEMTGTNQKDHLDGEDEQEEVGSPVNKAKPVPKSVRRRWSNLSEKKQEDTEARQENDMKPNQERDQRDEEERALDKLLLCYSKDPPPEPDVVEPGKQGHRESLRIRTTSLPAEPTTQFAEPTKGHARATSFEPEMLSPAGHVHPKLPDYDDFVARLAALRRES